jgi:D-methionine transport system substrate-binding protein
MLTIVISVKGTLYLLAAAVTLISAAQAAEEKVIRIGFNP